MPLSHQERRVENLLPKPVGEATRPWCRACGRPVDHVTWDRYEGNFWGFFVRCHGRSMGGLIDHPTPGNSCRLEVFCDDQPRMVLGPWWWWVGYGGQVIQESRDYVRMNGGISFFQSRGGRLIARHGLTMMLLLGMAPMVFRLFFRR